MIDKLSLGKPYFIFAFLLRESTFLSSVLNNFEIFYRLTANNLDELEVLDALFLETGCLMIRIGQLYVKLVHSWQSLTCLYVRSLSTEEVATMSTELQANQARIINTQTSRYTSCEMRRMTDCVLLSQAK